jgi:phosphoribosylformylglycinamidine synthase PurS subunit
LFTSKITVTIRKSILDPQGKAVEHSLVSLGFGEIKDTRIGKYIELKIETNSKAEAERITEEACKKLLANPVTEDYKFEIEENA